MKYVTMMEFLGDSDLTIRVNINCDGVTLTYENENSGVESYHPSIELSESDVDALIEMLQKTKNVTSND